jgi:hypothetical protein
MAGFDFFGLRGRRNRLPKEAQCPSSAPCPVCRSMAPYFDTVDLNKSCEEANGLMLPPSGTPVDYYHCADCGFCFAPQMRAWSAAQFATKIYNQDYRLVDPDYLSVRPLGNAAMIDELFAASRGQLRHLDYGGGEGLLSRTLAQAGWNSLSFDPFVNHDMRIDTLGKFDLLTAFEVFEHVAELDVLLVNLQSLCSEDGLILFSTLLSDGHIVSGERLGWWYAAPRNGHISLFSQESLRRSLQKIDLQLGSFSPNLHLACRRLPPWASHLQSA